MLSLSARRAWIEIVDPDADILTDDVALRKESVDRNNAGRESDTEERSVALRKESVDRNRSYSQCPYWNISSLSARRAWIEILAVWAIEHAYQRRSPQGERG